MTKSGELIGNYLLMNKMSHSEKITTIFSAKHTKTNAYVALKLFNAQDQAALEHFTCEVKILKKLNHPNIIRILGSGQLPNIAYIVTEFLEGVHLNRITPKDTGLPFKTLWPFIEQIGLGLIYIHQAHIAHLDLKPSNILLTNQENQSSLIKIIDFDIAKDTRAVWKNADEKPWGTPGYIAPERILKTSKPDIRSDIYSFGAVLAFLLTGHKPFDGETSEQILVKQLNQLPDVMNKSYLGKSPDIQKIIAKSMQKNPDDRFQNISEMMEALLRYSHSF